MYDNINGSITVFTFCKMNDLFRNVTCKNVKHVNIKWDKQWKVKSQRKQI